MTETCKECRFRKLCEESGYILDCEDESKCDRYGDYLEGLEQAYYMDN